MKNFQDKLQKYAELIVKVGVNVQKNQPVVLYIDIEQRELAHLIVKEAYAAGASEVILKWADTFSNRQFLQFANQERLEHIPDYIIKEAEYIATNKAARISVLSEDPDAFNDLDTNRISTYQKATGKALRVVRKATQNNDLNWTAVAAAGKKWAEKVFPDLKGFEAVDRLWEEIFKTTRINEKNPITAWKKHDETLSKKAKWLNNEQFKALHYNSPITDITVGLPKNHIWEGASSYTVDGIEFMANMPTEEVFTAPDTRYINGYVSSTKPLSYAGNIIEDMRFEFRDGKVAKASAKKGQKILEELLKIDAGASSLGEISLVPYPSPISQSNIIFFNTLFDENASNHMALGSAYPFSIQNGTKMSDEELKKHGLNLSQTHVDFMMGSADMNIDGIKEDGTIKPIFRNGDWA